MGQFAFPADLDVVGDIPVESEIGLEAQCHAAIDGISVGLGNLVGETRAAPLLQRGVQGVVVSEEFVLPEEAGFRDQGQLLAGLVNGVCPEWR